MTVFDTERLVIRPWTHAPADIDRLFDIYSRWEVGRWLGSDGRVLAERAEAAGTVDRWAARTDERGFGIWAVEVRETGLVAGTVLLVPLPEPALPVAATSGDVAVQVEVETAPKSAGTAEVRTHDVGRLTGDEVEVGWHFHPDSWHRGYATEAARGALTRGFAIGLAEIYAVVRPDNDPSLAVCRRLGMTPLGRTSVWYGVELEAFRITAPAA